MKADTVHPAALLTATGRSVPLKRCAALAGVSFGAVVISPVLLQQGHHLWACALFLAGSILLVGSVFYALRRTTCPRCKTPWLQYALGEKSVNGWLAWLTTFTECPECRLSASDAPAELALHKGKV